MASANALIFRPAHSAAAERGESVSFIPIELPK
jgi:hypothetical protein